jgi:uroporphyrinogen decarboxylase
MTARDRVAKALRHEKPDRVPIHEAFWEATQNRWRQEGLPTDISADEYFETAIRTIGIDNSFGLPTEEVERTDQWVTVRDNWGILKRDWLDHRSTPELLDFRVKSRADWEALKDRLAPDASRYDWEGLKDQHARLREQGKFVCISAIPGYEATWRKIGPEALLLAIADDPEWVMEMYEHDAESIIGGAKLFVERGFDFDGAWLWDDLAYKNGPLFSPKTYREQLLPQHKRVVEVFHSQGWPVILHSCGNITSLVPHLIEAGFDCLQSLEVKAGVDLGFLVREYGRSTCFMGGVDVRTFFADDEAELEREVLGKLSIGMSNPGGYVFHSDHSIPTQVSFQRYSKVVELVNQHGVYGQPS